MSTKLDFSRATPAAPAASPILAAKIAWEDCVDNLSLVVLVLDRRGNLLRANRTAQTWGLGDVHEAPGRSVHEVLHPKCSQSDCPFARQISRALYRLRREDRVRFETPSAIAGRQLVFSLIRNTRHERDGLKPSATFVVIEDADKGLVQETERNLDRDSVPQWVRRIPELRLVKSGRPEFIDAHLANQMIESVDPRELPLFENPLTGLYLLKHGEIELCNSQFAKLFGYRRTELCGQPVDRFLSPASAEELSGLLGGGSGNFNAPGQLAVGKTQSGERRWLQTSQAAIRHNGADFELGCVLDVTARIEAEMTLVRYQHELEDLAGKLLSAQEVERQRIASDLHDGIGQQLSVIRMSLEILLQTNDPAAMIRDCDGLRQLIAHVGRTIEEVRRISMDLRPPMLDDLGVVSATEWFCTELQKVCTPITLIRRICADETAIAQGIKTNLFRILQEACNNACKHSTADQLVVVLETDAEHVRLVVSDDGTGFDPEAAQHGLCGFGLSSMRERASLSGGHLAIHSAPGKGTRIEVIWPAL